MPVTKLDDKGRILLPGDIRKAEGLKEGDEFAVDSLGEGIFILKKIDLGRESLIGFNYVIWICQ